MPFLFVFVLKKGCYFSVQQWPFSTLTGPMAQRGPGGPSHLFFGAFLANRFSNDPLFRFSHDLFFLEAEAAQAAQRPRLPRRPRRANGPGGLGGPGSPTDQAAQAAQAPRGWWEGES